MKVLVILGGCSAEREVSLNSGTEIVKALKMTGHDVLTYNPGSDTKFSRLKHFTDVDVVYIALHGKYGEDGVLQRYLENLHYKFVGSGSKASFNCFDKFITTNEIKSHGIMVPETELVDRYQYKKSDIANKPHVLKPVDEGSSIDTFIITNTHERLNELELSRVFNRHQNMILCEFIEGIEITVPVLDTMSSFESLPVVEIITKPGEVFSFENKYNLTTQENCPPLFVPDDIQDEAEFIAKKVHKLMKCKGISRTDMIWNKDTGLYVLEINTLPGMTRSSLLPKSAKFAGYEFHELVELLINDAAK